MKKVKIFVYGTLMRDENESLAHMMVKSAEYIGKASVTGLMYNIGWFPGAIKSNKGTIHGEVYEIEEQYLQDLDNYEGYRENRLKDSLYLREKVDVEIEDNKLNCFIYWFNKDPKNYKLVESGVWHRDLRGHQ